MTMVARWNGTEIARSNDTVVVEGNHYFPLDDVAQGRLSPSDTVSHCPWKGDAGYYNVVVGQDQLDDAAWYYAEPKAAAAEIAGRIAFWKGVEVVEQ